MEFSVMACSLLQPNLLTCGTAEGDVYVIDSFGEPSRQLPTALVGCSGQSEASCIPGAPEERPSDPGPDATGVAEGCVDAPVLACYPKLFKSGVRCVEHHPRLPALIAVGTEDGSVHLLFLEGENLGLKKTLLLCRFNRAVDQLVWVLCDAIKGTDAAKPHSSSYVDRIWRSLERAAYHSLLVARAGDQLKYVTVERGCKAFNLLHNVVVAVVDKRADGTERDLMQLFREGEVADGGDGSAIVSAKSQEGDSPQQQPPYKANKCAYRAQGKIALVFNVKWPLAAYFERELEYPTLTNFCKVQEAIGIIRHHRGHMLLEVLQPFDCGAKVRFAQFGYGVRVPVLGTPRAVAVSPKQYNQINRHLATDNEHLFDMANEQCLNALAEFIAVATDEGYVYTTSMLHIYNRVHSAVRAQAVREAASLTGVGMPNPGGGVNGDMVHCGTINGSGGSEGSDMAESSSDQSQFGDGEAASLLGRPESRKDGGYRACSPNHWVDVDIPPCFVAKGVVGLQWALIWDDYTREPCYVAPEDCCCTEDIVFLLTVHTREGVHLLRLVKDGARLRACHCRGMGTRSTAVCWVEDTIPNDMTLLMATAGGMGRMACDRATVAAWTAAAEAGCSGGARASPND